MARAMPKAVTAGETLLSRLDAGERFGQAQLLNLLRGVGEELADAHRAGRFHGTITPADIRFDSAGEIGIDGWGRDTTPDAMRASRYAPIECYAPVHPQGPWTDVYSLGAVLWCAITAEPPPEVLHRKGDMTLARLAPAGFDPAFLRSVDSALEIAPQRRPQTVEQWLGTFAAAPVADPTEDAPVTAALPVAGECPAQPEAKARPWGLRHIWPVAATALAAIMGALWATTASDTPAEPAGVAAVALSGAPSEPETQPSPGLASNVDAPAAEAAPPVEAPAAEAPAPVAAAPPPPVVTKAKAAAPAPEPAVTPTPPPVADEPAPEPEPEATGEVPRALLARADKRLRQLFGDYARLRADVEDSYKDDDVPYATKRRAYREGLRIQHELVELRDVRNRIARTGNFQAANRRYDDFEAAAAQLNARIKELRRAV